MRNKKIRIVIFFMTTCFNIKYGSLCAKIGSGCSGCSGNCRCSENGPHKNVCIIVVAAIIYESIILEVSKKKKVKQPYQRERQKA